jgi:polyisoprenoid-binding protein YceI
MNKKFHGVHDCFTKLCYSGLLKKYLCGLLWMVLSGPRVLFAAEREITVDPAGSRVEVVVKATVDSFVAKLSSYQAQISLDATGARVDAATFRFQFADIKTGKPDRDEQMNTWQETAKFPEVVCKVSSVTAAADGRYLASGRLLFHGVERDFSFPVTITSDQSLFSVDGEMSVDTRDFGLPIIRKFMMLKVDPIVVVKFHLQGSAAAH